MSLDPLVKLVAEVKSDTNRGVLGEILLTIKEHAPEHGQHNRQNRRQRQVAAVGAYETLVDDYFDEERERKIQACS